jgi:hypothetical protein
MLCKGRNAERAANVCFGGRHRNRLFMAASQLLFFGNLGTIDANPGLPSDFHLPR